LILNQPLHLLGGFSTVTGALWDAGYRLWSQVNLNDPVTMAIVALAAVVGFYIIHKLVELLLKILKYLVIPALVLATLAMLVLHVPFLTALPVCALGCSLVLIVKG
jgi:hypothetical protein